MTKIDLNADLGELPGEEGRALDAAILAHVTSVSVACGGHAGDEATMRATFAAARAAGVRAGAHPSYPDRDHFGRRSIEIAPDLLRQTVERQVAAAQAMASEEGVTLAHLKPHGALYHDAGDPAVADVLAGCAARFDLCLYGAPGGALDEAASRAGVRLHAEGFADRAYREGALVPRSEAHALIEDEETQASQAIALARGAPFPGSPKGPVETICLHGDTPGAAEAARRLRAALEAAGVTVAAP